MAPNKPLKLSLLVFGFFGVFGSVVSLLVFHRSHSPVRKPA